jgi:hypothetical protein
VLRGGFGLFYDLAYGGSVAGILNGFPYERIRFSLGSTQPFNLTGPDVDPPPVTLDFNNNATLYAIDPHLRVPVVYEWNVALQQELGVNQFLSVTYVGSHGHNLLREDDLQLTPSGGPTVFTTVNGDWSQYNALQVQFRRRMARGLQAIVSYALAKSIDTNSSDVCACTPANSLPSINLAGEVGPSDFDVRNAFSAAVSYEVPAPPSDGFGRSLFKGWAIDGLVQSSSATPYSLAAYAESPVIGPYTTRPNIVPGVPFYISAPAQPDGC